MDSFDQMFEQIKKAYEKLAKDTGACVSNVEVSQDPNDPTILRITAALQVPAEFLGLKFTIEADEETKAMKALGSEVREALASERLEPQLQELEGDDRRADEEQ